MKRRNWSEGKLNLIELKQNHHIEFNRKVLDRAELIHTLKNKVNRNKMFKNAKGKFRPRSTRVAIVSKEVLFYDEVVDLIDLIHHTGVRVVSIDIPPPTTDATARCQAIH